MALESADPDMSQADWTRHRVSECLGISIASVRRLEGRQLHPTVDGRGVHLFRAVEVELLRSRRAERPISKRDDEGEIAARVFELFRSGADLRKAVITARVPPRVVRELYSEWLVSLNAGEQRRRDKREAQEDQQERTRMEREHREWLRSLQAPPAGLPTTPAAGRRNP